MGDYNNDGYDDLFVTYYGQNALYRNHGDGTFTDVTKEAGLMQPGPKTRWNTGCTFVDYDKDGHLDLFVANYVDFDLKTAPPPEAGPCTYKGLLVACGPPGLRGGKNILYHNNGNGTFSDVSEKAGIWNTPGTYGLSVAASDLDNDGWPDIYVANDSTTATLYQNQKDGTFKDIAIESGAALSPEGKPQAGMGVSIGDYNRDGNLDVVKTNFAGDTDSLYTNLGDATFEDRTYPSGLGVNTRLLGWGVGFFDMDNDGWLDILMSNGHVYPEVDKSNADLKYAEHKYLYRNLQNGRFEEVTDKGGPGILENAPARGCAFGDYDNDGDIDVAVNCVNAIPQLLRCDSTLKRNWIKIKLQGVKSNRSGIGTRVIGDRQDEAGRGEGVVADGRAAQRRKLLLAERSAHALRPRSGHQSGQGGDSLAERAGGSIEGPGSQQALRHPGGRQDSEGGNVAAGRKAPFVMHMRAVVVKASDCRMFAGCRGRGRPVSVAECGDGCRRFGRRGPRHSHFRRAASFSGSTAGMKPCCGSRRARRAHRTHSADRAAWR